MSINHDISILMPQDMFPITRCQDIRSAILCICSLDGQIMDSKEFLCDETGLRAGDGEPCENGREAWVGF